MNQPAAMLEAPQKTKTQIRKEIREKFELKGRQLELAVSIVSEEKIQLLKRWKGTGNTVSPVIGGVQYNYSTHDCRLSPKGGGTGLNGEIVQKLIIHFTPSEV